MSQNSYFRLNKGSIPHALGLTPARLPCGPEFLHKAMHVGMGIAAFLFPWLFIPSWSVVLLAGPLRQMLGGVIQDMRRDSW